MRRRYAPARLTQHVVQRGVNRDRVFFSDAQREDYLCCLEHASRLYGCAIHAYVLMSNHTHILATPERAGGLSRMMQWLGARFVTNINETQRRTGTLWESRFWSSAITTERYVLTCYRYIELNPVRAGIAGDPATYAWSSYPHNALAVADPLLVEHGCFRDLGVTSAERHRTYRSLMATALPESELEEIREALNGRRWLGAIPTGAGHLKRGRPRNVRAESPNLPTDPDTLQKNGSEPIS